MLFLLIFMIKKFSLYTLTMLLIPIAVWLTNWQWSLAINYPDFGLDYFLFLLTETGSVPYALITCILFTLILVWVGRRHYAPALIIVVCGVSMVSTQAIKSGMKLLFEEPRPFVSALFEENTADFYQLPRKQRSEAIVSKHKLKINRILLPLIIQKRWGTLFLLGIRFLRYLGYYFLLVFVLIFARKRSFFCKFLQHFGRH